MVAGVFNNLVVPAGEVTGPVIGGLFTQMLGSFRWASFYFGCFFMAYGALLVVLHLTGVLSWRHHKEVELEKLMVKRRFLREASLRQISLDNGSRGDMSSRSGLLSPSSSPGYRKVPRDIGVKS